MVAPNRPPPAPNYVRRVARITEIGSSWWIDVRPVNNHGQGPMWSPYVHVGTREEATAKAVEMQLKGIISEFSFADDRNP